MHYQDCRGACGSLEYSRGVMNRVTRNLDWEQSDSSDSGARAIDGVIISYQEEPPTDCGEEISSNENEEEKNIDGLTPSTLESRFEGNVSVDSWRVGRFTVIPLSISRADMRSCVAKFVR